MYLIKTYQHMYVAGPTSMKSMCQDPQLVECHCHGFTMQGCVDVQGSANGETVCCHTF